MPTSQESNPVPVRCSEPSGGESRFAGESPASGILDRVPDDIRRVLSDQVVDQLLAGADTEEEIVGPGGLLSRLTRRLVERAMEVEMTDHLGYEPHREPPGGTGNTRNGGTPKSSPSGRRTTRAAWAVHGRVGDEAEVPPNALAASVAV